MTTVAGNRGGASAVDMDSLAAELNELTGELPAEARVFAPPARRELVDHPIFNYCRDAAESLGNTMDGHSKASDIIRQNLVQIGELEAERQQKIGVVLQKISALMTELAALTQARV